MIFVAITEAEAGAQRVGLAAASDLIEREVAARALVALYAERVRLARDVHDAWAVDVVLAKGDELDEACERFRRAYYPRRGRCFVGLYRVIVMSRTGRTAETILDLFDEYQAGVRS